MEDETVLRDQAVALRRSGMSRRQIRDELKIWNNDKLNRLLKGEPPPEWTKRPRAKDDLRAKAREMRIKGSTYDEIQDVLGVSKGSISLWVRDLPKPPPHRTRNELAKHAAELRWELQRKSRDDQRQTAKVGAARAVGELSDRELFVLGVGLYWAEGTKDKPYDRRETVTLINSDPNVILIYLAWLRLLGVDSSRLRYRVSIHESADVRGAERYWADLVGIEVAGMSPATLKKHNPKTVRKNVGEGYHGCLVVRVLQCAELYWRIEGWWSGLVVEVKRRNP